MRRPNVCSMGAALARWVTADLNDTTTTDTISMSETSRNGSQIAAGGMPAWAIYGIRAIDGYWGDQ
jgi:hypothetical protein